ncbi:PerC family transcriptional regulator, partial [Escherichia coli]
SEVAKAADATLRRMGIASPSGEAFRKGPPPPVIKNVISL